MHSDLPCSVAPSIECIQLCPVLCAVSPTVAEFSARLGLSAEEGGILRAALQAVREGDEGALTSLGMPPSAWTEVSFVFSKLIKSGFLA